ncbi:hypothetical protein Rhal01_00737 [Rubritalea halochordaticola]|uniref:HTH lysR-type domain-containing protein n=1 Tax=Rubritalea halochordaticola TaxID=714537 RepID=A0ABP9UY00_9BACT
MNLTIKQLEYFVQIAKSENISIAASELNITQPALSAALQKIEQDLGIQLFDRSGGRLALNNAGKLLLPRIERLLFSYTRVLTSAQKIALNNDGPLNVSVSSSPWTFLIKTALSRDPRFVIYSSNHYPQPDQLIPAECDAALLYHYLPLPENEAYQVEEVMVIPGICSAMSATINASDTNQSDFYLPASCQQLLMPAEELVMGIKEIKEFLTTQELSLNDYTINQLTCFDQLAASCLNPCNLGILPGNKKLWQNIYGNSLQFKNLIAYDNLRLSISLVSSKELNEEKRNTLKDLIQQKKLSF